MASPFILNHISGDLFSCDEDVSLVHCVSEDLEMGKGIAVQFKKRFKQVEELKSQKKGVGDVAILSDENRFVYYLITKKKYWQKPTLSNLQLSLNSMKSHIITNKIHKIAMPMIGCGLDRLSWEDVQEMIRKTFYDTDIVITVYKISK